MVYVSVSENDCVDRSGVDRELIPVALTQLLESLEEAAVDEHLITVNLQQMSRSCDGFSRAEKLNCGHRSLFL
jgi:hypothetical protein